jgi:hypothetical protein
MGDFFRADAPSESIPDTEVTALPETPTSAPAMSSVLGIELQRDLRAVVPPRARRWKREDEDEDEEPSALLRTRCSRARLKRRASTQEPTKLTTSRSDTLDMPDTINSKEMSLYAASYGIGHGQN